MEDLAYADLTKCDERELGSCHVGEHLRRSRGSRKERSRGQGREKPRPGQRERARPAESDPIARKEKFWTIKLRNFRYWMRGGTRQVRSFQIYRVREAVYTVWGNFSTPPVEDDRDE
jgi:hypothetical protein